MCDAVSAVYFVWYLPGGPCPLVRARLCHFLGDSFSEVTFPPFKALFVALFLVGS